MFTEEDGTSINNKDSKEFQMRKIAKIYPNFLTFNEPQKKSAFFKIAAQVLSFEIFLKFSYDFGVSEAHFLTKVFLIRKRVVWENAFL